MNIEVGKSYVARSGRTVKVVHNDGHHVYPFDGSNGHSYTSQGKVYCTPDNEHEEDLISEVVTINPRKPDADPVQLELPGIPPAPVEAATKLTQEDQVNHPSHYTSGDIECIDAIKAALTPEEFRGYLKGNIIKYTWRERLKAGIQSMQKAQWYINKFIEVFRD